MATADALELRREPALGRAFLLAAAMHIVLIAFMFVGVRWQNYEPEIYSVELWEPQPEPQAVEPPKPPPPPPKVEAPKPEPEVKKPEIVEKAPPPKPKPKPKPEAKRDDEIQRNLLREQVALEQRKLDEERRKLEERRRADDAQRKKAEAERLATVARNNALSRYTDAITRKVRQNWILPQDLQGNPEAIFDVVQLPTGEVISAKLSKSSGNPAYDAAVERAILKSSPLPLPEPRSLFDRRLKLTFRPRD
jgi:colicin import membrane protein